jgi:hypothetical protein
MGQAKAKAKRGMVDVSVSCIHFEDEFRVYHPTSKSFKRAIRIYKPYLACLK